MTDRVQYRDVMDGVLLNKENNTMEPSKIITSGDRRHYLGAASLRNNAPALPQRTKSGSPGIRKDGQDPSRTQDSLISITTYILSGPALTAALLVLMATVIVSLSWDCSPFTMFMLD